MENIFNRPATCKQINDHITLISDNGEASCYVVEGTKYAAVIDTLQGMQNLYKIVREITTLPLKVINTHGHGDHVFGNVYFDRAYLNNKDLSMYNENFSYPEVIEIMNKEDLMPCETDNIEDKDIIDLGGITLEVITAPGHTAGSICILDKQDRILFTGDAFLPCLWLQLPESLSIKEYNKTVDKFEQRRMQFDHVLTGHGMGLIDGTLIEEIKDAVSDLLLGKTQDDIEYINENFKGKALQHKYHNGENIIVYTKEKL